MALNKEQEEAVTAITVHCLASGGDPFFVLEGPAGTGKTYCLSEVVRKVKVSTVFTAPTNKAVRVLKETLTRPDYTPATCTIHSLLGLRMSPDGEVKVLAKPEETFELGGLRVIVVDEAGMINKQLMGYIERAAKGYPNIRWVFMGDRWQLPPVGELLSPVWGFTKRAELTKVMRTENQILGLSVKVREQIPKPFPRVDLTQAGDNEEGEGVWSLAPGDFSEKLRKNAESFVKGEFKAIAWRNIVVDKLNLIVRREYFAEAGIYPWQVGDRITLLSPAMDLEGEKPLAATDDEGVVESVTLESHPTYPEFTCWAIRFRADSNFAATLWVLHGSAQVKFSQRVTRMAAEAKGNPGAWKAFWMFKDSFHSVRHAYATTAHRAQGSTYQVAFVNWRDILQNPNRGEAYRCLYVAVSRPKRQLYLG